MGGMEILGIILDQLWYIKDAIKKDNKYSGYDEIQFSIYTAVFVGW